MKEKVIVIGGGLAGVEAAYQLAENGIRVCLLEKEENIGGHIKKWVKLFPDFSDAETVKTKLIEKSKHENILLHTSVSVSDVYFDEGQWHAKDTAGCIYSGDVVLLATGFEEFDASRKEELGYGIYDNIITSVEFEAMTKNGEIRTKQGMLPQRIAFLNCVGSRDEKVGNKYCSKACCINAVKQAVEYKEFVPDGGAYVFYMDLRMFGQCYEELYRKSQEKYDVNYIRGRISEAAGTIDQKVQLKAEDTLAGLPLKITVDMFVLMVGMEPSHSTRELSAQNNIQGEYGFAKSLDMFYSDNLTEKKGLFLAGTCKRPLTIPDTIADARASVVQIMEYIKQ